MADILNLKTLGKSIVTSTQDKILIEYYGE